MPKMASVEAGMIPIMADGVLNVDGMDRTVFTPGGKKWKGVVVGLLHLVTWLAAMILVLAGAQTELNKHHEATEHAKTLTWMYGFLVIGIIATIVAHASVARREDKFMAPLLSVVLLFLVGWTNLCGAALLGYSISLKSMTLFNMYLVSNILVALASAMVVAFYVLWQTHGTYGGGYE